MSFAALTSIFCLQIDELVVRHARRGVGVQQLDSCVGVGPAAEVGDHQIVHVDIT